MPDRTVDSARPLLQRMAADETPANRVADAPAPVERVRSRPKPACRTTTAAPRWTTLRQKLTTKKVSAAQPDASQKRQRMMTMMVGLLSLVFVGVLYVAFGGIGQTRAATGPTSGTETAAQTASACNPESWQFPQPLPTPMRNPMVIPSVQIVGPAEDGSSLTVRGIVHSDTRPSAIVNDQIVFIGETVGEVKVVNITRDTVEFETDGKRWTQGVQ